MEVVRMSTRRRQRLAVLGWLLVVSVGRAAEPDERGQLFARREKATAECRSQWAQGNIPEALAAAREALDCEKQLVGDICSLNERTWETVARLEVDSGGFAA